MAQGSGSAPLTVLRTQWIKSWMPSFPSQGSCWNSSAPPCLPAPCQRRPTRCSCRVTPQVTHPQGKGSSPVSFPHPRPPHKDSLAPGRSCCFLHGTGRPRVQRRLVSGQRLGPLLVSPCGRGSKSPEAALVYCGPRATSSLSLWFVLFPVLTVIAQTMTPSALMALILNTLHQSALPRPWAWTGCAHRPRVRGGAAGGWGEGAACQTHPG